MNTNKRYLGAALVVVALLGVPGMAAAEVLELAPAVATAFTDQVSGVTSVVLRFDLSGLVQGEGRVIDEALLDWPVTGWSNEGRYEIVAFPVTASWTAEGVGAMTPPEIGETKAADWDIESGDVSQEGGALVRLNLTDLVREWVSGRTTNNGIEVRLPTLTVNGVTGQLPQAKLTVRYGFRPE